MWLVSEREYGDFEFECLVQSFADSPGNSGIQIRSRFLDDPQQGPWMHGPQIDLHPPDPFRCGMIYDETRDTQRWICPPLPDAKADPDLAADAWGWIHSDGSERRATSRDGQPAKTELVYQNRWNRVHIVARGLRIETDINGVPISRFDGTGILDDDAHRKHNVGQQGHLALQLHAGDNLKIRFKELRIRSLEPLAEPSQVCLVRDDAQLRAALKHLRPGTVLRIAPGTYQPGVSVSNAHGMPEQPIIIEGLDPRSPPLFEGGKEALHLSDVSHIQLRWLHCRGQHGHAINMDEAANSDTPCRHVTLAHVQVED